MKKMNLTIDINKEDFKRRLEIKDGKTPTREELTNLILPLIPEVKDGYTPKKGVDFFDGKDGLSGKDGSPDTPKQVKAKLLKEGLSYDELKNLPDIEKIARIVGKQASKTVEIEDLNVELGGTQKVDGKYVIGNNWDKPYGTATFTYDVDGNVATKSVGGAVLTFEYDIDGNVETITDGTRIKSFIYDIDGNVEAINYS